MLTIFNINDVNDVVQESSLLTVNIFHFVLIVDFEQANLCLVHIEQANVCLVRIEKATIFENKIGHIMRYVLF